MGFVRRNSRPGRPQNAFFPKVAGCGGDVQLLRLVWRDYYWEVQWVALGPDGPHECKAPLFSKPINSAFGPPRLFLWLEWHSNGAIRPRFHRWCHATIAFRGVVSDTFPIGEKKTILFQFLVQVSEKTLVFCFVIENVR